MESTLRQRGRFPRIENRNPRHVVIGAVARDDCEPLVKGGSGNDEIGMRAGMAGFPALFQQEPPSEHDIFRDRKNPSVKHGPHFLCQPIRNLLAARPLLNNLNAEANFSERENADVKLVDWPLLEERNNPRLRPLFSSFRYDIRIDQPRH